VVVVLNEHSGFGASNAAPTAAGIVRKWLELKEQDARDRDGANRPAASPPPVVVPPPAPPPGRPEKPARAFLRAAPGVPVGA
jgi:penicillin-binding protein 2